MSKLGLDTLNELVNEFNSLRSKDGNQNSDKVGDGIIISFLKMKLSHFEIRNIQWSNYW